VRLSGFCFPSVAALTPSRTRREDFRQTQSGLGKVFNSSSVYTLRVSPALERRLSYEARSNPAKLARRSDDGTLLRSSARRARGCPGRIENHDACTQGPVRQLAEHLIHADPPNPPPHRLHVSTGTGCPRTPGPSSSCVHLALRGRSSRRAPRVPRRCCSEVADIGDLLAAAVRSTVT